MVSEKGLSLKRTVPFLLIGILIFLVYLYFFADISQTIAIIQGVDLFYYSIAVAVLFLIMIINALTWQYFLRPLLVKVSFRKTFLFTWIGVFVDLLVPAESLSGEASKVYLMTKESGENAGKVVASVVSHRILAMIISLGSLIFSSIILYAIQYELPAFVLNLVLIIIVGTGVALFFISLCILKETLTQRIIDAVIRFLAFVSRGRLKLDRYENQSNKCAKCISWVHSSFTQEPQKFGCTSILFISVLDFQHTLILPSFRFSRTTGRFCLNNNRLLNQRKHPIYTNWDTRRSRSRGNSDDQPLWFTWRRRRYRCSRNSSHTASDGLAKNNHRHRVCPLDRPKRLGKKSTPRPILSRSSFGWLRKRLPKMIIIRSDKFSFFSSFCDNISSQNRLYYFTYYRSLNAISRQTGDYLACLRLLLQ